MAIAPVAELQDPLVGISENRPGKAGRGWGGLKIEYYVKRNAFVQYESARVNRNRRKNRPSYDFRNRRFFERFCPGRNTRRFAVYRAFGKRYSYDANYKTKAEIL